MNAKSFTARLILAFAALALSGAWSCLFLLLLAPAMWVSGYILLKCSRDEFQDRISRNLLPGQ